MQTAPRFATPQAALRHHVTGAIQRGEATAIVERPPTFESALLAAMQDAKRRAKQRNGAKSMSAEGWLQRTRLPSSSSLDGAPRGTNARYYLAEMSRRLAAGDSFCQD